MDEGNPIIEIIGGYDAFREMRDRIAGGGARPSTPEQLACALQAALGERAPDREALLDACGQLIRGCEAGRDAFARLLGGLRSDGDWDVRDCAWERAGLLLDAAGQKSEEGQKGVMIQLIQALHLELYEDQLPPGALRQLAQLPVGELMWRFADLMAIYCDGEAAQSLALIPGLRNVTADGDSDFRADVWPLDCGAQDEWLNAATRYALCVEREGARRASRMAFAIGQAAALEAHGAALLAETGGHAGDAALAPDAQAAALQTRQLTRALAALIGLGVCVVLIVVLQGEFAIVSGEVLDLLEQKSAGTVFEFATRYVTGGARRWLPMFGLPALLTLLYAALVKAAPPLEARGRRRPDWLEDGSGADEAERLGPNAARAEAERPGGERRETAGAEATV